MEDVVSGRLEAHFQAAAKFVDQKFPNERAGNKRITILSIMKMRIELETIDSEQKRAERNKEYIERIQDGDNLYGDNLWIKQIFTDCIENHLENHRKSLPK